MYKVINYDKSDCCNYARSDSYALNFKTEIELVHQRTMCFNLS